MHSPIEGGHILVVDDDEGNRGVVCRTLERNGYSVLEAHDGREALHLLFGDASDVRLIISEIDMPEMSGLELLKVLSSYVRLSLIPVVVVSGARSPAESIQFGSVVAWLVKPFAVDELLALVRKHVAVHVSAR